MRGQRRTGKSSPKAVEGRTADPLYDFLYKDSYRLASFYAQIFSGRLLSTEETILEAESSNVDTSVNAVALKSGLAQNRSHSNSLKSAIDPHDTLVTDVLRHLHQHNLVNRDIGMAKNGELVSAKGRLTLFDSGILKVASGVTKASLESFQNMEPGPGQEDALFGARTLMAIMDSLEMPSTFTLIIGKDLEAVGVVSATGMQEPISSYHFKHGSHGLADVSMIGIKEQGGPVINNASTDMAKASQGFAEVAGAMMFDSAAIRVTPLVLFRQIY